MARWFDDYFRYRPSRPREAKGGIKARSRRGAFGASWWARRWIEVLESFDIGARLGRGRSYARSGQVLAIEVSEGAVKARVQGSRPTPYEVLIKVKTLSRAEWKKVGKRLGQEVLLTARLMAGEMPENIEEAFAAAGASLFPLTRRDLKTKCSCPDRSNPCKHIAAVYYLLGEEFDRDPFLIFKLRGMTREGLMALIAGESTLPPEPLAESLADPLPVDPAAFWGEGDARAEPSGDPGVNGSGDTRRGARGDPWGEVRVPPVAAALPRRLGGFPFWRGKEDFLEAMERIYREASPLAMEVLARVSK